MKIMIDCVELTERKVLKKVANRKKGMKREKTRGKIGLGKLFIVCVSLYLCIRVPLLS